MNFFSYRANAKPACDCAWCQASRGARFLAYLRAVTVRAFVLTAIASSMVECTRELVTVANRPEECRDSTYTIDDSNFVHCSPNTTMRAHDMPNGHVQVQCWCQGHEPKGVVQ